MKCQACGSSTSINYGNAEIVLCSSCNINDLGISESISENADQSVKKVSVIESFDLGMTLKAVGISVIGVGLLLLIVGLTMNNGIDGYYNLDMAARKQNFLMIACFSILIGIIVTFLGKKNEEGSGESKNRKRGRDHTETAVAAEEPSVLSKEVAEATVVEQLEKLANLYSSGVLTEEEFESAKTRLLS